MYVQSCRFIAKLNLLFFVVFVNVAVVVAYVKLPNKAQSTYPFLLQNRNFSPSVWPPVHTNPARTVSIPNSETKLCNFNTTRAFPSLLYGSCPPVACVHTPPPYLFEGRWRLYTVQTTPGRGWWCNGKTGKFRPGIAFNVQKHQNTS